MCLSSKGLDQLLEEGRYQAGQSRRLGGKTKAGRKGGRGSQLRRLKVGLARGGERMRGKRGEVGERPGGAKKCG